MNLLTTNFKADAANRYLEKVTNDIMYVFGGKPVSYTNDEIIEPIQNTTRQTYYQVYDEMVFAKKLSLTDASIAIRNIPWVAGVVYDQYDDIEDDLDKMDFYVITQQGDNYGVFKCLSNNNNALSVVPPLLSQTSPNDEFYQTSDGYIWKLMYTTDRAKVLKYGTNKFFPLTRNQAVESNAVSGAIDKIIIEDVGLGYITHASGIVTQVNIGGNNKKLYVQGSTENLSALQNFYKDCAIYVLTGPAQGQLRKITEYGFDGNNRYIIVDTPFSPSITTSSEFEISPNVLINGDGQGFQARAIVNPASDRIENIEIINRGSGYTNGIVSFGINTEILDLEVFKEASARIVLPPQGGHGYNSQMELFGTYVVNSVDLFDNEVPVGNDFRQVGIIENPIITDVILVIDTITDMAVGNIITQGQTTAIITDINPLTFEIKLTDVNGHIDPDEPFYIGINEYNIVSVIKGTVSIDARKYFDVNLIFGSDFIKDEIITQESTGAIGVVHEYNENKVYITNITGNFAISNVSPIVGETSGSRAYINNITQGGIKFNSGRILFIENTIPITRNANESERIKIVIGF